MSTNNVNFAFLYIYVLNFITLSTQVINNKTIKK